VTAGHHADRTTGQRRPRSAEPAGDLEIVVEPEVDVGVGSTRAGELALLDLTRLALVTTELSTVLGAAVDVLAATLAADRVAIVEATFPNVAMYRAGRGWPIDTSRPVSVRTSPNGPIAFTMSSEKPVVVRDVREERHFDPGRGVRDADLRSAASVALRVGGEPFGAVLVHGRHVDAFGPADVSQLVAVAELLEAALFRHRTEQNLRDAAVGVALEAGRTGTWSWEPGTPRAIWSGSMERLCGLEAGSFGGTQDAFVELIHPDDRAAVFEGFHHMAGGPRIDLPAFRVLTPRGEVRWLEGRGSRVDPDDPRSRWVGVCVDVTDHVRERQRLARTLAHFDTLLSHAPAGFAFLDTDLHYVEVSERLAEMVGVPAGEMVGATPEDFVPELWAIVEPQLRGVIDTGEAIVDCEISGTTPAQPGVEHTWLSSFYPVDASDGRRVGVGVVSTDITGAKRAERHARLVASIGRLYGASMSRHELLDRLAHVAVPEFACACVVYTIDGDGRGRHVAVADPDPEVEARLRELLTDVQIDPMEDLPAAVALRTGAVTRIEDVDLTAAGMLTANEQARTAANLLDVASVLSAPMVIAERVVGTVTFLRTRASGVRYKPEDEPFARELALRMGRVLESARLAIEADEARDRLDGLARLGELLTVELESHSRLAAVARAIVPTFADTAAVYLADSDAALGLSAFAHVDPERESRVGDLAEWPTLSGDSGAPQLQAFRRNAPVLLPRVPARPAVVGGNEEIARDLVYDMGVHSLLCVPLPGPTGPIGTLALGYVDPEREYHSDDVALAREIARRVGPAIDNALRFEHEHAIVDAFQRGLLPERLPRVRGVELAARYLPGGAGLSVGGDLYEVLPLEDGRVLLAIGDVVGHGVRAAAAMGRVRSVLQFCATRSEGPADVLGQLNEHLWSLADSDMATLLVMLYDPLIGRLELASAGHPPPLVRAPDGTVRFIDEGRGVPLRITTEPAYEQIETRLEPGATLLLYTDGLVERRGESLDRGLERLQDAWRSAPDELESAAEHVVAAMLGEGPTRDDVALLMLRTRDPAADIDLWLWAHPRELATLRAAVREWVMDRGAQRWEADEISLAVNEAATNAIEHAYGREDREFVVSGAESEGVVEVRVRDFGRWREARPRAGQGWGLELARALMDSVVIESTPEGTEVRMERRLRAAPADGGGAG
jgi:PAS domain S-box-containing protein